MQTKLYIFAVIISLSFFNCGAKVPSGHLNKHISNHKTLNEPITRQTNLKKPFPNGLYESGGPIHVPYYDAVANTQNIAGQDGVLVRVNWNLCQNDINCLIDTIAINLNTAETLGLHVALAVSDGHNIPQYVKNSCELFAFEFMEMPQTMCEVWDENYLNHKNSLIQALAENFDNHPALSYIYFNTACSTNGYEGHCRINEVDYTIAGYTENIFDESFTTIMQYYLDAFTNTPIVFEAHAIFTRIGMWESVWELADSSNQVGAAAWWCSERLSLNGDHTTLVWPLIQEIAQSTFSVCQTVGQFTEEPYRFTDFSLGFDYGQTNDWDQTDVLNAFHDTIQWLSGFQTKGPQTQNIIPFSVLEAWTEDLRNPLFQNDLSIVLDVIFKSQFEQ